MEECLATLNTNEAVVASGFFYGFSQTFYFKNSLERPLSTLFNGALSGLFYSTAAGVISCLLPRKVTWLIPVTIGASIIYKIATDKPSYYIDSDSDDE